MASMSAALASVDEFEGRGTGGGVAGSDVIKGGGGGGGGGGATVFLDLSFSGNFGKEDMGGGGGGGGATL